METKTELMTVIETSGLEKTKGQKIAETLGQFFDKANEWQTAIESIKIESHLDTDKMKVANQIRLSLKNKRIEGTKIVREQREVVKNRMADDILEDKLWLKSGQIMEAVFDNLEAKAEYIENFAKRYEAEQKEILYSKRVDLCQPYSVYIPVSADLRNMSDSDFEMLLTGAKMQHDAKVEAEKKAEFERLENIRIEAERIEAQRIENERLKAEAEKREAEIKAERERVAKEQEAQRIEAERLAAIEREKVAKEFEAKKAEAEKLAKENAAKLEAERAERIRVENELIQKQQAERDRELKAIADKEAELQMGDADKFNALIQDIDGLKNKYKFTSKKYQTIYEAVNNLLTKSSEYAVQQAFKLK
jgi:hypothetical protein